MMQKNYHGDDDQTIELHGDDTLTVHSHLFRKKTFAIKDISTLCFDEGKLLLNMIPVRNGRILITTTEGGMHQVFFSRRNRDAFRALYLFLCQKTGQPVK